MKKFLAIAMASLLMISTAACTSNKTDGSQSSTAPESSSIEQSDSDTSNAGSITSASDLKVVCLLNGNLGDKSFFDSANEGIKKLKTELGIQAETIELGFDNTKWQPAVLEASEQDWDIIIVGTWQMQEILEEIAPQFPDKKYILFDSEVNYANGDLDNVYSITYKQNHGSYLAGMVAAGLAKEAGSDIIGAVNGVDIPVINDFLVGYIQGAKDMNPDVKVRINYIGNFDDTAKAKEMALSQYNQDAYVVFNCAAQAGLGVIDAAKEKGLYTIGVDADQSATFTGIDEAKEKAIATSVLKNIDTSIIRAVKLHMENALPYGTSESLGLLEGAVGIAKNSVYNEIVSEEVRNKVEQAEASIIAGEIEVVSAFAMTTDEIVAYRDAVK